nr:hypothetical protein [Tanacetum cinerariifolium]
MDYTTNQFDDDVDLRMNEPVTTDEGFIQKVGTDAEMTNVQQGNENSKITPNQVLEDAHQVKSQPPQILSKEVSNFAPSVIKSIVTKSLEHAVLAKESLQPKSTYEAAATLTEFELKKILIDKIDESQSYLTATEHRECYDRLIKSYDLDKSLFSTYDKVYSLKRSQKDKDKDEDPFSGSDQGLKKRKTSKDEEPTTCPKTNESKSGSSKGGKSQSKSPGKSVQSEEPEFEVVDSDFPQDQEENLGNDDGEPKRKVASKRDWLTKPPQSQEPTNTDWNTKDAQYDLPSIKDMVQNIWSPVKVAYDKHALWGISHWRDQCKTFYGYARGLESTHDVYSTTRIMAVTLVEHDYSKESQRSLVGSQKLPEEDQRHQAKNYQTRHQEKGLYTSYQYPQGFIYVDTIGRNRLMRSDELYKFSNGTLTRLRTSLNDITKNIQMKYLPQRRWSSLEKKKANIMIKAIDKQLKERRMMRSLKKFILGRHYRTDLRLLQ